jgi:hypothetical protein
MRSIATLVREWPDPEWRVLFNRGVPALEWSFSSDALAEAARDAVRPTGGRLLARIDGPADEALAFGLACGAPLAVQASVPWNDTGPVYGDYIGGLRSLRDLWDVSNAEEWQGTMNALLGGAGHDPDAPPDLDERIARYEERLRADGLPPPRGPVRDMSAHDLGRAVHMARRGLEAHFCDQVTAERLITEAGERCRQRYGSWAELSAAWALGQALRLGDEGYDAALAAHRTLTEAADGPWQTVPWRTPR